MKWKLPRSNGLHSARPLILLSIILVSVFLTGCFNVDGDFRNIRNIALHEYGNNFVKDHEFALGSFELWIAGGIANMFVDDELAEEMISSVSGIQVGTYRRNGDNYSSSKNLLKKIDKQMAGKGWRYIVKSYEHGKMSAVYINRDPDRVLKELFVINIDNNEMQIVQISGDLEKIIETAIREEGFNIHKNDWANN